MEQITNIPPTPLNDDELAALLSKDTFVSTDEVEETDADKVDFTGEDKVTVTVH